MFENEILKIQYKALKKMLIASEIMLNKHDEEILGYLVIEEGKKGIGLTVTDIIIPEQKTSSVLCKDDNKNPKTFCNIPHELIPKIKGWFHSHKTMGLFYSSTDDETLENWCYKKDYAIGIVVSLPDKLKIYIQRGKPLLTDKQEIEYEIEYELEEKLRKEIEKELETKVKTKKKKKTKNTDTATPTIDNRNKNPNSPFYESNIKENIKGFLSNHTKPKWVLINKTLLNVSCIALKVETNKGSIFQYIDYYSKPKKKRGKIVKTYCECYTTTTQQTPTTKCDRCKEIFEDLKKVEKYFPYQKQSPKDVRNALKYTEKSINDMPKTTNWLCEHIDYHNPEDVFCLETLEVPDCVNCKHNRTHVVESKTITTYEPKIKGKKLTKKQRKNLIKKGWVYDAKKGWVYSKKFKKKCPLLKVLYNIDGCGVMQVFSNVKNLKDIDKPSFLCAFSGSFPDCESCTKELMETTN